MIADGWVRRPGLGSTRSERPSYEAGSLMGFARLNPSYVLASIPQRYHHGEQCAELQDGGWTIWNPLSDD
jgi:hypothetical protein